MAKVKKIMLTSVTTLKKDAKTRDAAKILCSSSAGCIVVVDDKKPVGIITGRDIVKGLSQQPTILKEPVSRIMATPATMDSCLKIDEALKIIDTKRFRHYPVVENGQLVGLATKKDVVNYMSNNIRLHRNIQDLVLVLFVLFELFIFVIARHSPFG